MDKASQRPQLQFGPYLTQGPLGRPTSDGQTSMFIATHQETGSRVALRVLPLQTTNIEVVVKECETALSTLRQMVIPHSVKIEDYGHTPEAVYVAVSLMTGGTLQQRMLHNGIGMEPDDGPTLPSAGDVLQLAERVCEALQAMHDQDMIHGQIEPRNIMFDEDGDAYVSDIGLMRLIKILYNLDTTNSLSVSKYTPPELWQGEKPDARSDQYTLACLLYELLTGQAPFNSASIFALMKSHTNDDVKPPHLLRKDLPAELAVVFWQALAKPPSKRHRSIMSFYDELETALSGQWGDPTDFFTEVIDLSS